MYEIQKNIFIFFHNKFSKRKKEYSTSMKLNTRNIINISIKKIICIFVYFNFNQFINYHGFFI